MSIIQTGRDVLDLLKKGATLEAQKKLIEMQEEALFLQEENIRLREESKKLNKLSEIRGKVKWTPPFYTVEDGSSEDGQYCHVCYDEEEKLIRLQDHKNGAWTCNSCKTSYTDENFHARVREKVNRRAGGQHSWMGR